MKRYPIDYCKQIDEPVSFCKGCKYSKGCIHKNKQKTLEEF